MAILKVTFPHYDEDGKWFMAGDFREVPDDLVEFYLRPSIQLGVVCMAIDEQVWAPAKKEKAQVVFTGGNEPVAELGKPDDSDLAVAVAADSAPQPAPEKEPAAAEDAPAEPKKKGKK